MGSRFLLMSSFLFDPFSGFGLQVWRNLLTWAGCIVPSIDQTGPTLTRRQGLAYPSLGGLTSDPVRWSLVVGPTRVSPPDVVRTDGSPLGGPVSTRSVLEVSHSSVTTVFRKARDYVVLRKSRVQTLGVRVLFQYRSYSEVPGFRGG